MHLEEHDCSLQEEVDDRLGDQDSKCGIHPARRRIVACRDVKMGIAMLMEVRAAIIIFPAVILPIFLTLFILLIGIPTSFSSLS